MRNQKGFTLIEIIAVVTILGIMGLLAIIGISNYIEKNRRKLYIDTAREYIKIASGMIANNSLVVRDTNVTYYYHINNLEADSNSKSTKKSPYGEWVEAYVVIVLNEDKTFEYYWTSIDDTGHKIDLTAEKDLTIGKIEVTDDRWVDCEIPIGGREYIFIMDDNGDKDKFEI